MAIYRNISTTFWTDSKISDEFSADDKYIYLYLFTNPHTNLCGCYEISFRQMAYEASITVDKAKRLINRLEKNFNVIRYNLKTKEVLILNWYKYNWTKSEKFRKPLLREIEKIKDPTFKGYLLQAFNGEEKPSIDTVSKNTDTVFDNGEYPIDTTVSVSVTDTVTVTDKKTEQNDIFSDVPEEIKDAFMDWIQMRKDKKKPIRTKRAVTRALNKLNALTKNPEKQRELIDYAIYRNWESFYPIPDGDKIPKPKIEEKKPEQEIDAVPMPDETRDKLNALGMGNVIGKG